MQNVNEEIEEIKRMMLL